MVSDENGGGTSNTSCNTSTGEQQVIGALHFYALAPLDGVNVSDGASPANPRKLGIYVNPNPGLDPDPLQRELNGRGHPPAARARVHGARVPPWRQRYRGTRS